MNKYVNIEEYHYHPVFLSFDNEVLTLWNIVPTVSAISNS